MTDPVPPLNAEVLAIGDELVNGQATDTNSGWLARELAELGIDVCRFTVVRDTEKDLQAAIQEACARSPIVIATGGLGPTQDDLTREAAAAAAGCDLRFDEPSWKHIQRLFESRGRRVHASNRSQAFLPDAAEVLENRWGTAPGFRLPIGDATFTALPGVPREMKPMFELHVVPLLRDALGLPRSRSGDGAGSHVGRVFHNMYVLGCTEASLGERIAEFMARDHEPRVGVTASWGLLTIRIAAADVDEAEATAAAIRPLLGRLLVSEGREPLAQQIGGELLRQEITCAVAESCTGGLLGAALTDVPGISAVFLGGMTTYSDEAKLRHLAVPEAVLEEHGAVSLEVAEAMARGVVASTGARMGVAITGIAGPDGGTQEKPVGTVCFGLCLDAAASAHECRFGDLGREFIRRRSVWEALATMHRALVETGATEA